VYEVKEMITEQQILEQLPNVLDETHLDFLGEKYEGKVRDNYVKGDTRYLITTDRLSCFDVVVTTIPFKGQVLNQLAVHWFKEAGDIIENHIIDIPDPNVMVVKNCNIVQIEMIVRAYITGSAWRDYEAGKSVSGITLPEGLKPSQKLETPIITPSTKAEKGSHDEPISEEAILSKNLVDTSIWEQMKEASLALFSLGQKKAAEQGLLLVDTKYEFGLLDGRLVLADEIHTLDSSRYWISDSYQDRFNNGVAPEMLDKEPTRQWLLSQGYKGEGEIPEFTDEHRAEISKHYIDSFARVSGHAFEGVPGNTHARIEKKLKNL
jgi:phosphoribosylaminoimidazole-succinocarboxamide synthase